VGSFHVSYQRLTFPLQHCHFPTVIRFFGIWIEIFSAITCNHEAFYSIMQTPISIIVDYQKHC